jgi:hypothetical protein
MRFLMRMGYDNECFAAAVLSLAVKGYLRVREESGILGMGRKFTLEKTATGAKELSADEHQLLASLFAAGDTLVLVDENHELVSEARSSHGSALKDRFTSGFFNINGGWHVLGIALSLVLAAPAVLLPGRTDNYPEWHFTTPGGWFTIFCIRSALPMEFSASY